MRRLLILVLLACPAATAAPTRSASPPPPLDCYVLNNTDHEIRIYAGRDTLAIGQGRLMYEQKLTDKSQTLELTCEKADAYVRLVGTPGAVTIERVPTWFRAYGDEAGVRIVATRKGATVEVDGAPVKLKKRGETLQPVDARAKLVAGDPAVLFDPAPLQRTWTTLVGVKATAGKETVTLTVRVGLGRAMETLLEELRAADKTPVSWAAAPDHAGPGIVFGCARDTGYRTKLEIRDYELVRSPSTVAALSLVAICEPKWVKLDTCPPPTDKFAHGERVDRYRLDADVRLIEAKTSKVIAATTLKGTEPGPCRETATRSIVGEVPGKRAILEWMNTVK